MEACGARAPVSSSRLSRAACLPQGLAPAGSRTGGFSPFPKSVLFSLIPSGPVSFATPLYVLRIALGFKKIPEVQYRCLSQSFYRIPAGKEGF